MPVKKQTVTKTKFQVGDYVEVTRGDNAISKGDMACIVHVDNDVFAELPYRIAGADDWDWVSEKDVRKVTPTHCVVWADDSDPFKLFSSAAAANAFAAKMRKKRDVVSVLVFKLVK